MTIVPCGEGAYFFCLLYRTNHIMKGMMNECCTPPARRFKLGAVLAMHVPNLLRCSKPIIYGGL